MLLLLLLKHHHYRNMKESHSITNNLLIEVDVLTNRLRNIKKTFKTTQNIGLKERLFSENKNIFKSHFIFLRIFVLTGIDSKACS